MTKPREPGNRSGPESWDRPDREGAHGSSFEEAMSGVTRLADREKLLPLPLPTDAPPRVPRRAPRRARFEIHATGERVDGRADGVPPRTLARLRSGEVPVDRELDLHRLAADAAERRLREALTGARRAGARCVLVVHGRGRHSRDGPVLKEALVDWLQRPPLSRIVMAFASALDRDGGAGATYVLLRRER